MSEPAVGRGRAWVVAARPQTLPAAIAPVVVGSGLAVHDGVFAPLVALAALVGAALIQVGTNLANDYYDAVRGADSADRDGFTRVTQAGLIDPARVRLAAGATFGLAVLMGTALVYVGGLPVVAIGLASVVCGWAYTGGPAPLGYLGLGELFVFVFFGVVAVAGTYYVQAAAVLAPPLPVGPPPGTVTLEATLAGVAVGALATCMLVVNNVRDRETDAAAGKRTLAVRLGYRFSRLEFAGLLAVAYLVPLGFVVAPDLGAPAGLPLLTLPYAVALGHTVWRHTDGRRLNPALERTGRLLVGYAVLFATGVVLA